MEATDPKTWTRKALFRDYARDQPLCPRIVTLVFFFFFAIFKTRDGKKVLEHQQSGMGGTKKKYRFLFSQPKPGFCSELQGTGNGPPVGSMVGIERNS